MSNLQDFFYSRQTVPSAAAETAPHACALHGLLRTLRGPLPPSALFSSSCSRLKRYLKPDAGAAELGSSRSRKIASLLRPSSMRSCRGLDEIGRACRLLWGENRQSSRKVFPPPKYLADFYFTFIPLYSQYLRGKLSQLRQIKVQERRNVARMCFGV